MKTYVLTKTYTNIYSSIIHSCQKREQSKCQSTEQWINNVIYTNNGIVFNLKKKRKILTCAIVWMTVEDMLNEVSQLQKDKYCRILLTWGTQSSENHKDRKYDSCQGLGGNGELLCNGYRVSVLKMKRIMGMVGGAGCTRVWIYLIPRDHTIKNG